MEKNFIISSLKIISGLVIITNSPLALLIPAFLIGLSGFYLFNRKPKKALTSSQDNNSSVTPVDVWNNHDFEVDKFDLRDLKRLDPERY